MLTQDVGWKVSQHTYAVVWARTAEEAQMLHDEVHAFAEKRVGKD